MTLKRRVAAAGVLGLAVLGAYLWNALQPVRYAYCGDGVFEDAGWQAASDRYVLILGSHTLSDLSAMPARYVVGTLPPARMRLGLRFTLRGGGDDEAVQRLRVHAKVTEMASGNLLFAYDGPLMSAEGGFVARRSGGSTGPVELVMYSDVPISEARGLLGSLFMSCTPDEYLVELNLLAPNEATKMATPFEIVMFGGGWK